LTLQTHAADAQAWLADIIGRIADHPGSTIDDLLPWNDVG